MSAYSATTERPANLQINDIVYLPVGTGRYRVLYVSPIFFEARPPDVRLHLQSTLTGYTFSEFFAADSFVLRANKRF